MFQHKPNSPTRTAFTLIELLLVITILAVMSSMAIGVMRSATEDAKEAATRSRIVQIEAMLQVELENYEVRRLPVSIYNLKQVVGNSQGQLGRVRQLRRQILADIINAEMPQPLLKRDTSVTPNVFGYVNNPDLGVFPTTQSQPLLDEGPPDGFKTFLDNKYSSLSGALTGLRPAGVQHFEKFNPNSPNSVANADQFDNSGEYLYEILNRIDSSGMTGVESLGNAAIGNSDNDAFPEVVDAWGKPLQLRILQVGVDENTGNDLPTDWSHYPNPDTLMPQGYVPLNPNISRPLTKIRFQVISPTLGTGQ